MGYELEVLHPATAQWLTENGYDYDYEVEMPYGGRADFIATKDGETIVIEVKDRISSGVARQILDYGMQTGISNLMVAIPSHASSPDKEAMLLERGIGVIKIDADTRRNFKKGAIRLPSFYEKWEWFMRLRYTPVDMCKKMIEMHTEAFDSPLLDLAFIYSTSGFDPNVQDVINDFVIGHPFYHDEWQLLLKIIRKTGYSLLVEELLK